MPNALGLPE
ncbi:hypothetical protein YPPY76_1744, partial [Yersinia pestis PY-76]